MASSSSKRKGGRDGGRKSQSLLNHAVAFQDHMARLLFMPNGGQNMPVSEGVVSHDGREVQGRGHRLTLAQRQGLVAAPRSKLSELEWIDVHSQSLHRGDLKHECCICYEPFRDEDRVLLSCSHTFHKHCLAAFERFSKQRCCPLCRTLQYQKKNVSTAREIYQDQCAIAIQSAYRGHAARKLCRRIRLARPPNDPHERKEWCAERLSQAGSTLMQRIDDDCFDVDQLLRDIDAKIDRSRAAREKADTLFVAQAHGGAQPERGDGNPSDASPAPAAAPAPEEIDWKAVKRRACRRKDKNCAICLGALDRSHVSRETNARVVLLTCSHMFHQDCINIFELFQEAESKERGRGGRGGGAGGRGAVCPICRSNYKKKTLHTMPYD